MEEHPAWPPLAGTARLSAHHAGHRCLLLGTGPQTALLHVCLVHRLSKPAASSLLDTGGFPVSYLFSTRLLVKGVPDSTSGICPYWGKTLSVECDAVKQGWLFGGGWGGWAPARLDVLRPLQPDDLTRLGHLALQTHVLPGRHLPALGGGGRRPGLQGLCWEQGSGSARVRAGTLS